MNNRIKTFSPSWPATVMGTGILPIALNLSSPALPWMREAATGFFFLSLALLLVITLVMALRLVRYPEDFAKEFLHPVAGSFIPTLPIAYIIVAIDFLTLGAPLFGEALSTTLATWLFGLGATGIWLLGPTILAKLFASTEVKLVHATFGWYIPPVSQLIVAVGGLELMKHLERGPMMDLVFILSLAGLGVGTLLFLFVGANVYGRYLFLEAPGPKMAPSSAIGFAPTAVLTIAFAKLASVVGLTGLAGFDTPIGGALLPLLGLLGLATWGFSVFGFLLALLVIGRGFAAMRAQFGLTWWALTFPLGAFAVATGALGRLLGTSLLTPLVVGLTILTLLVWAVVAVGTLRGIGSGKIFERD